MVALSAWFDVVAEGPTIVRTAEELEVLLDQVADLEGPTIVELFVDGDLGRAVLDVGLHGAHGILYYAGGEHRDGTLSKAVDRVDVAPVLYYYMNNDREFPADAEVSVALVRAAAHQYMETGGDRPTAVDWQPRSGN
ncbi:Imm1 family immunity protein [Solihabitans fulvus]|uniref:Imm1 family immunity protein n=1 Tax=Solihabitans fulvus TaxID=1892852 RepID=UPI001661CA35|nr:Imm1 family immunity protein [Solihabitans fulvus]